MLERTPKLQGKVRWLKAMEGFPDDYVSVNAKNNPGMITRLRRMGNDLAGTENALAIYIIQNPR
jgi:hypothetical protein